MFSGIEGLDGLLLKLSKLSQLKHITGGLKLIAAHIQGILQVYPVKVSALVTSRRFKTEKQRRYFFWALKNGKIEVPYRRGQSPGSRNLKQQWRIAVENPMRVELRNPTAYGPYVQGAKMQTFFHRNSGWVTDEQAVKEAQPMAVKIMRQRVDKVLAGLAED